MKINRGLLIIYSAAIILVVSAFLKIYSDRNTLQKKLTSLNKTHHSIQQYYRSIRTQEFDYLLHGISYPPLISDSGNHSIENYRLIFAFKNSSCDLCIKKELSFINRLYASDTSTSCAIIIDTQNTSQIELFRKNFNIKAPIFYPQNDSFFKLNSITHPSIMFLQDNNRIISVLLPTPGTEMFADTFFQFCSQYFLIIKEVK